jgi:uncharacterized protein YqgQ
MFPYNSDLTYCLIKMKNTLIIIFLLASNFFVLGQKKEVPNYKYIIVPERFSFLKENDQFQTSSLTKFLLKKNGFTVFLDSDEYPIELKKDPCKALTAEIIDKSSLFKTTVLMELKNCAKKTIYTSEEGYSKLKDYKQAFQESIRNAHASMSNIKFVALENPVIMEVIKEPVANIPKTRKTVEVIPTIGQKRSVNKDLRETDTLYAQPNENGFQLIDLKPEVVFLILKTNLKDVFIIKDKNGVLYKKSTTWFAAFYENGELVEKRYEIKF